MLSCEFILKVLFWFFESFISFPLYRKKKWKIYCM